MPRRRPRMRRFALAFGLMIVASLGWRGWAQTKTPPPKVPPEHAAQMAKGLEVFKKHVKPVLLAKCVRCHGGRDLEAELNLTDRDGLVKGGQSGPAIVPGQAKDSLVGQLDRPGRKP